MIVTAVEGTTYRKVKICSQFYMRKKVFVVITRRFLLSYFSQDMLHGTLRACDAGAAENWPPMKGAKIPRKVSPYKTLKIM